jgi:hypothetical protein
MSKGRIWTEADLDVVREHYPVGGSHAVIRLLKDTTVRSIQNQAHLLGLKAPPPKPFWTEEEDTTLRTYYAAKGSTVVGKMIGRTAGAVRRRAIVLNVVGTNKRPRLDLRMPPKPKPNPIKALRKNDRKPATRGFVGEAVITSETRVTICPAFVDTRFKPGGPVCSVVDSDECRPWARYAKAAGFKVPRDHALSRA